MGSSVGERIQQSDLEESFSGAVGTATDCSGLRSEWEVRGWRQLAWAFFFSSCLAEEHFGGGNAIVENLFFQWSCRSRRKYRNTGNNKTKERRGTGSTAQTSDFLLTGGCHFYFVGLDGGNHWPASFMCWVVFSVGLCPLGIGRQATSKEFLEWIQRHFPLANIGFPTSWESWLYLGLPGGKLVAGEGRRG